MKFATKHKQFIAAVWGYGPLQPATYGKSYTPSSTL